MSAAPPACLSQQVSSLLRPTAVLVCRYTGTTPNPPPGSHYTSPSENMWNTGAAYSMGQGMAVSGEVPESLQPEPTCSLERDL